MLKTTKGSNYLQFTSSGNYSTCQVASPHLQPTEFIYLPETTLHSSWYTQISCDLSHLAQWLATCVTDNSPDNGNQRSCKLLIGHSLSASVSGRCGDLLGNYYLLRHQFHHNFNGN